MPLDDTPNVKPVFDASAAKARPDKAEAPAQARKETPARALRPGGGWRPAADAVDAAVRAGEDAAKARREWAAPEGTGWKPSMRESFQRGARR